MEWRFLNTFSAQVKMVLPCSSAPINGPIGCTPQFSSLWTSVLIQCFLAKHEFGAQVILTHLRKLFEGALAACNSRAEAARGRYPNSYAPSNCQRLKRLHWFWKLRYSNPHESHIEYDERITEARVIVLATTAIEQIGRSVPAPSQGISLIHM